MNVLHMLGVGCHVMQRILSALSLTIFPPIFAGSFHYLFFQVRNFKRHLVSIDPPHIGRLTGHIGRLAGHIGRLTGHIGRLTGHIGRLTGHIGRLARMSVLDTEVDGSNPSSSMLFP